LDKPYVLSFSTKKDKTVKFIDDQEFDEMLLKTRPLIDFEVQFRRLGDPKSHFEN